MNDSKIAAKLRAQLKRLLGELLPHFSKPQTAFLGDIDFVAFYILPMPSSLSAKWHIP